MNTMVILTAGDMFKRDEIQLLYHLVSRNCSSSNHFEVALL